MGSPQSRVTVGLFILVIFLIKGYNQSLCGRRLIQHEPLITNGFASKEGDWPWSAAIYHATAQSQSYKCGGTLLNSNTILTAAHCVYENNRPIIPQRVLVQLGKFYLKLYGTHTQEFQVYEIIPHYAYDTTELSNDIAIIRLSTEATLNNYVQPICLWDSSKTSITEVINKFGTVVGWGFTETDETSIVLRQAVMPVVSHNTCLGSNRDFFGTFLSDTNFCAGFRNGTSVCNGDSGGSITFEEDGVYRIRGIVSLSVAKGDRKLCYSKEYVIFTDVAQYLTWIKDLVPQLKGSSDVTGKVDFQQSGNVQWSFNCDFAGGDIAYQKSRMDECGEICSTNVACTHFTWTTWDSGLCIMKYFDANVTASVLFDYSPICGRIIRPPGDQELIFKVSGNVRWAFNCDFFGGDIANEKAQMEDCGGICSANKECTHFTWTNYANGLCLMKHFGANATANVLRQYTPICGWVLR